MVEWLELGLKFHGHLCGGMPLGFRTGLCALERLGVEREPDSNLVALVETGEYHMAGCWVDGIMLATGCTYGKGNVHKLFWGKFALTLVDTRTRRAVRVAVKPEVLEKSLQSEFIALRRKGVPASEVPESIARATFERFVDASEEDLFASIELFEFPWQRLATSFDFLRCERCGEMVVARYMRVGPNGERLCIPCAGEPADYPQIMAIHGAREGFVWPGRKEESEG